MKRQQDFKFGPFPDIAAYCEFSLMAFSDDVITQ